MQAEGIILFRHYSKKNMNKITVNRALSDSIRQAIKRKQYTDLISIQHPAKGA